MFNFAKIRCSEDLDRSLSELLRTRRAKPQNKPKKLSYRAKRKKYRQYRERERARNNGSR